MVPLLPLKISTTQSQNSLVYVKEQMGHSSIQTTVEAYRHLIPGANVSYVDRLDMKPKQKRSQEPQPSAPPAQPRDEGETGVPTYLIDSIGGGGRDRTASPH